MVKVKRPSAADFWPDNSTPYSGPVEPYEPPIPAPPPRRPTVETDEEDDGDDDDDDLDPVDRPERNKGLNPTCVTPLIATLAQNIYRDLLVAGTSTRINNIDAVKKVDLVGSDEYIEFMDRLLELVHALPSNVFFEECYRISRRNHRNLFTHYSAVKVNTLLYKVNDIVILPAGEDGKHPAPLFPANAPTNRPYAFAGDLFWFARILSIQSDNHTAHVQWLQHSAKTILDELAHPQELFLTNLCGDVDLASFLARCNYRKVSPDERPLTRNDDRFTHSEFFYSLFYDQTDAVFRDISEVEDDPNKISGRIGSCGLCAVRNEEDSRRNEDCTRLPLDRGQFVGFERAGVAYHCQDVVLIRSAEPGPCLIGQIISIEEDVAEFKMTIQVLERMNDVIRKSDDLVADQYEDRHLFLTDRKIEVNSNQLLGKAFILHKRTANKTFRLRGWLNSSPYHFFLTRSALSMRRASQGELTPLGVQDFQFCKVCIEAETNNTYDFLTWKEKMKTRPLRAFDPFAGSGAFVLAMCEAVNLKFTHAIEIDPSGIETIRTNSPGTVVYNQCSNKMLEWAVSRVNGSRMTLNDLLTDEELPEPPRREDIDCIISGFPCKPHSSLNMFQRANDLLNELFLNTISWVEHLRPKYCCFENVPGFVRHNIGATQKDRHTVQGGIEQGGIKFICRALTALGYQVRFAILQAAHYGTPQSRERFFLWAARTGFPLPELPPRTHDFSVTKSLSIGFTTGDVVRPISTASGIVPLPFVTIRDAISDLKRWDWVNPHRSYRQTEQDRQELEARRHIERVRCHDGDESCGIGGAEYEHEPRSAFQARCRKKPTKELQHVTQCLPDDVIERTLNIPLEAGANYKSLNNLPLLWQYLMTDASSANARHGYKTEFFGRLEADKFFPTTVTNVHPTAKQSRVLNPWCKRIVTVRELARAQGFPDAFEFVALDHKVKTMHTLIGNAVAWQMGEALGRELEKALYKETKEQIDEEEGMEY